MAKRQRASSSTLFLMELIMAIMFFSIAATICIFVFARSHIMHRDSSELNEAIVLATNTAEIIRSADNEREIATQLKSVYPSAEVDNNLSENIIIKENGYTITIEPQNDDGLLCSIITIDKNDNFVYELYVEHLIN